MRVSQNAEVLSNSHVILNGNAEWERCRQNDKVIVSFHFETPSILCTLNPKHYSSVSPSI